MKPIYLIYLSLIFISGLLATFLPEIPQAKVGGPIDKGDTAWLLTASGLVLLMTPGLSFFYGGMVRKKECHLNHAPVYGSFRNYFNDEDFRSKFHIFKNVSVKGISEKFDVYGLRTRTDEIRTTLDIQEL
jgi:hypothetical protein